MNSAVDCLAVPFEALTLGQSASLTRVVQEADIVAFAELSGDTNPIHLDAEFAATTRFGSRIAHGMLTASYISALLGTRLPGVGAIFMELNIRFRAPVRIGDAVTATVTVFELLPEKAVAVLEVACTVGDTVVLDGHARMKVPRAG